MIIRIKNLRLRTIIGVYEWERQQAQEIVLNIELEFDGTRAAASDIRTPIAPSSADRSKLMHSNIRPSSTVTLTDVVRWPRTSTCS